MSNRLVRVQESIGDLIERRGPWFRAFMKYEAILSKLKTIYNIVLYTINNIHRIELSDDSLFAS